MPVQFSVHRSTMHIELDRPARRNAIDAEMAEQLEGALDVLEQRADLRVAIISGAGGHFSAGTDLHLERSPATERGGEYGIVRRTRSKPIIAAGEGIAFRRWTRDCPLVRSDSGSSHRASRSSLVSTRCRPDLWWDLPRARRASRGHGHGTVVGRRRDRRHDRWPARPDYTRRGRR